MERKGFTLLVLGTLWTAAACADVTSPSASLTAPPAARAPAAQFTIVDLGIPFGANGAGSWGINERGDVVGQTVDGTARSFGWSARDGFIELSAPGSARNFALRVNAGRTVVGWGAFPGVPRAWIWNEREGARYLLDPALGRNQAWGINERGDVVGNLGIRPFVANDPRPFLWSEREGLTLIPLASGWVGANAIGINNAGVVVGEAKVPVPGGFDIHAFVWTRQNGTQDLGRVGPVPSGTGLAAINERGQAVGTREATPGGFRAIMWTAATGMVDIHPPGAAASVAFDINDRGEVVGGYRDASGVHAFVRTAAGEFITLPSLVPGKYSAAGAINERGEIAGDADDASDRRHPVLWTR